MTTIPFSRVRAAVLVAVIVVASAMGCGQGVSASDRVCYLPSIPDGGCLVISGCSSLQCGGGQVMAREDYQKLGASCGAYAEMCQ